MQRVLIRNQQSSFLFFCLFLFLGLFVVSCNRGIEYSSDRVLTDAAWHKDTVLAFDYVNKDTLTNHDLFFYIRHTTQFPHANLYLFVEVLPPSGPTVVDTVNYRLASPQGEWYGRGFGSSRQLLLPYHSDFRFTQLGSYRFCIRHGMRYDVLQGVEDFGVQVYEHIEEDGKK